MKTSVKKAKPQSIDEYLARVPAESRAALKQLRRTIKSIAPEALETISFVCGPGEETRQGTH